MLTITRKQGESIILEINNEKIEVLISSFRDRCVRICIDAPKNVNIIRKELQESTTDKNLTVDKNTFTK